MVSRIMSRDTTRYSAFDTTSGFGRHGWPGETKTDCREGEYCSASHGIYLTSFDVKVFRCGRLTEVGLAFLRPLHPAYPSAGRMGTRNTNLPRLVRSVLAAFGGYRFGTAANAPRYASSV